MGPLASLGTIVIRVTLNPRTETLKVPLEGPPWLDKTGPSALIKWPLALDKMAAP